MRQDGRADNELRAVKMTPGINKHAEGSVLIEFGDTKIICTATVEDRVPPFMKGQGRGWITAEYSMLPRATQVRNQREAVRGKLGGRTMEIQRLIGRALRSVVNLRALGERSVTLDCDVIQADGGTRTTAISGAYVAMIFALHKLVVKKQLAKIPVSDFLASVSVGMVKDVARLDLNYEEDVAAAVDMNVVMTGAGEFVEIQGTGEEATFSRAELDALLGHAELGIKQIIEMQKDVLGQIANEIGEQS